MDTNRSCVICIMVQIVAPWFFILAGAAMAFFAQSSGMEKVASFTFAIGFIWLAVAATLAHVWNKAPVKR